MKKFIIANLLLAIVSTNVFAETYYCPQVISCDNAGKCHAEGYFKGDFKIAYRSGKYHPGDQYIFREARFLDYMEMNWTCGYTNNYASPTSYLDIKSAISIIPKTNTPGNRWVNANVWGGEYYCRYKATLCPFSD